MFKYRKGIFIYSNIIVSITNAVLENLPQNLDNFLK